MKIIEFDTESDRIANSILILAASHLVLAIILTPTINNNLWTPIIAISCGFALSLGYYIRSTLKSNKIKKKSPDDLPQAEVDGG